MCRLFGSPSFGTTLLLLLINLHQAIGWAEPIIGPVTSTCILWLNYLGWLIINFQPAFLFGPLAHIFWSNIMAGSDYICLRGAQPRTKQ